MRTPGRALPEILEEVVTSILNQKSRLEKAFNPSGTLHGEAGWMSVKRASCRLIPGPRLSACWRSHELTG